jgi:hypothetical protein
MQKPNFARMKVYSLTLATFLAAPAATLAADNGIYVGVAAGEVDSDYDVLGRSGPSDDGNGFKLIGGVRPLDRFAIEANYVDLGETDVPVQIFCITTPCPTELSIETQALSVSAVALLPLPLVDLFGRAGFARYKSKGRHFEDELDDTDLTYGVGAQFRIGSIALHVEYEHFDLDDDSTELMSVGLTYTFL